MGLYDEFFPLRQRQGGRTFPWEQFGEDEEESAIGLSLPSNGGSASTRSTTAAIAKLTRAVAALGEEAKARDALLGDVIRAQSDKLSAQQRVVEGQRNQLHNLTKKVQELEQGRRTAHGRGGRAKGDGQGGDAILPAPPPLSSSKYDIV